jgi:hypothetical protein
MLQDPRRSVKKGSRVSAHLFSLFPRVDACPVHVQIDLEIEDCHWVPKAAIDAMLTVIARFPNVPTAPFLNLLTQLNKIWRQRGLQQVQDAQQQHERELADFRRASHQATPYQQKVMHQRLNHLKNELKKSRTYLSCSCSVDKESAESLSVHGSELRRLSELTPSFS